MSDHMLYVGDNSECTPFKVREPSDKTYKTYKTYFNTISSIQDFNSSVFS